MFEDNHQEKNHHHHPIVNGLNSPTDHQQSDNEFIAKFTNILNATETSYVTDSKSSEIGSFQTLG